MELTEITTKIIKEIQKVELKLNDRYDNNGLRMCRLIGEKEGLNLALEIISKYI